MDKQDEQLDVAAQIDVPAVPAPDHHLVVVHPFGAFSRGDAIRDADQVAAILAGENAHHCRKVFPQ